MVDLKLEEMIARIYWEELDVTQRRNLKPLVAELKNRKIQDAGRKSHLADKWEKRGCVVHQVLSGDFRHDPPPRVISLECEILRHFVVRHVIVVKTSQLQHANFTTSTPADLMTIAASQPRKPIEEQRERELEEDQRIHECLAAWGSSLFLAYHRKGDSIGVGPGRGPSLTVECICLRARKTGLPSAEAIVSLSGAMSRATAVQHFDADQVAGKLRDVVTADLCPINSPLFPMPHASGKREKFLSRDKWQDIQPQVALVGIGALAGPHRMLGPHISDFDAARKDLDAIRELATQIDSAYRAAEKESKNADATYHCIGDMCNRLFIVAPPDVPDSPEFRKVRTSIRREFAKLEIAVNRFNRKIDRAVTAVSTAQLQQVATDGAVMAIAGGRFKRYGIRHVLTQDPPWITHLVTDDATARWLCDGPKASEQRRL